MSGKPTAYHVSPRDRRELESWVISSNTKRSLADRARMILWSGDGVAVADICTRLATTEQSVYKWRNRFSAGGIEGLRDLPRSGQPRTLSPELAQRILQLTVERIPHEATHWSIRLMMKYSGASEHHVREVWRAADLRPHRIKNFKISNDPRFAEKVVDVVGLYLNPPANAMVLSVDEKTQIQALERTQPLLPLAPARTPGQTHDYRRHGTASLYAAFDIATGEVIGQVTQRHRAAEFISFLKHIAATVPPKLDLHIILDNSSTHKTDEVKEWLKKHPRFHLHFTPTSASWLNAVEGWFSQLEKRSLYRSSFSCVAELREELRRFIAAHNRHSAKPFKWTTSADAILTKVEAVKRTRTTHGN